MNQYQDDGAPPSNSIMSAMTHQNLLDPSIVQMRLDTETILEKIELNLSGKRKVIETLNDGTQQIVLKGMITPLCNPTGIHSLLTFTSSIVNVPVVQANYKEQWYFNYCADIRQSLVDAIILNQEEWGIHDSKLEYICDMIMALVEPFVSRTLNNKERESLSGFTATERIGERQPGKGLFGMFG